MASPEASAKPRMSFLAGALIVVGALMAGLCGTCTGFVWVASVWDLIQNGAHHRESASYEQMFLFISLFVGVLPTLVGALLLWLGLRRRKRDLRPPPSSAPPPG